MPCSSNLIRRIDGSWPRAKLRAGLIEEKDLRLLTTSAYDDADLLADVAAAASAIGRQMTRTEYQLWRETEGQRRRRLDPRARVASETLIRMRFGGPGRKWRIAVRAALKRHAAAERTATERIS